MRGLLTLLLLSTPFWAGAAPCSIPLEVAGAKNWFGFASWAPVGEEAPLCADLLALRSEFEKLRATAGFTAEQLVLDAKTTRDRARPNAFYRRPHNGAPAAIEFSYAFLSLHVTNPATRRWVTAHEIGHAIQFRDGDLQKRDPLGEKSEASLELSRRLEAHADAVALELLHRAGFPAETVENGVEHFLGCAPDGRGSLTTHPAALNRWLNAALLRELKVDGFDDGKVPPLAPAAAFQPMVKIDDMNAAGRLKPGRLLTPELAKSVPAPQLPAARDAADALATSPTFLTQLTKTCGAAAQAAADGRLLQWLKEATLASVPQASARD